MQSWLPLEDIYSKHTILEIIIKDTCVHSLQFTKRQHYLGSCLLCYHGNNVTILLQPFDLHLYPISMFTGRAVETLGNLLLLPWMDYSCHE